MTWGGTHDAAVGEDIANERRTEEGLAIEAVPSDDGGWTMREVGHFEYVICEYQRRPFLPDQPTDPDGLEITVDEEPSVVVIAERIADLEARCAAGTENNVTSIDQARWKWNLKAAKRRLRRLVRSKGRPFVEVPIHLQELVRRVLEDGPEPTLEFDSAALNKLLWEDGAIHDVYDYERRKADRVVIVMEEIPAALRCLLDEANEAYFHGLFRATAALCRSVLEDILRRAAEQRRVEAGPVPIIDERLEVLINCIPGDVLSARERRAAHEIRVRGNEALHDSNAAFSEDDTWRLITITGDLVGRVVSRVGGQLLLDGSTTA